MNKCYLKKFLLLIAHIKFSTQIDSLMGVAISDKLISQLFVVQSSMIEQKMNDLIIEPFVEMNGNLLLYNTSCLFSVDEALYDVSLSEET